MGNVIFNALIAGGSGGGSVQPVPYTEIVVFGDYFSMLYSSTADDAYVLIDDSDYYTIEPATGNFFNTSFSSSTQHNVKIYNVNESIQLNTSSILEEVKRIGSTLTSFRFMFAGASSNDGIKFSFPFSDLNRQNVYEYQSMFSNIIIRSFPDISNWSPPENSRTRLSILDILQWYVCKFDICKHYRHRELNTNISI